jgi:polyisoprenoid-binding protein YceI
MYLVAMGGLAWLGVVPASVAGAPERLSFGAGSRVWLEGDSTLHPYKATATQFDAVADVTAQTPDAVRLSDLSVSIPVRNLKSGENGLDDNMYKALQASRYPTIRFSAPAAVVRVAGSGSAVAEIKGRLSIAGVDRDVLLQASGMRSGGTWRLSGSEPLNMSQYGIEPPVLFGGLIKCTDRITVRFELVGQVR